MTDQITKLAPQIWAEINKAHKILLSCHVQPDPDSVGANLALKLGLEKLGKQVTLISGDTPPLQSLSFLPGSDQIINQDITQVHMTEFDIFISLDTGSLSQLTRKKSLKIPFDVPTIVIDHHASNPRYGLINLVEPNIVSTSELIFSLFTLSGHDLVDTNIAMCLFTGIYSDSGGFRYEAVTGDTLRTAGQLLDYGVLCDQVVYQLMKIPVTYFAPLGEALSLIKTHHFSKVLVLKLPLSFFTKYQMDADVMAEIKEIITQLLNRNSPHISVMIYERELQKIGISIRANNPFHFYNVILIAKQLNFGGGHAKAAGGQFTGTVDEAEAEFFRILDKTFPEVGQP